MYQVTPKDIAQYWERGYWISPKLIDDDRIARLRRAMDRLFAGAVDGHGWYFEGKLDLPQNPRALQRVINAWWVNDEIRDMILDPGLGKIAADLMKVPRARFWSDQAIIKPGDAPGSNPGSEKAANIGWHQDKSYWHITSTDNMVTAWIALQDTDLSNGGMRTLVGSHRWGLIADSDKFYDPNLDGQREAFMSKIKGEWIDEPCILKAGQASFHHALTFHGSGPNLSKEPRLSVVGHYMPDGTTFVPTHRFQMVLRLLGPRPEPGMKIENKAFPLVYPAERKSDTTKGSA
jgi:ectoine hydroxylase-related dioxygenase (phytanoyl-CoA dioxygenase family)